MVSTPATAPRLVACPTCGKQLPWSAENPYRPFCSERCKSIDFGAWAAEEYRVPETPETEAGLPGETE